MPEAPVATPLQGVFAPRLVARLHRERFEGTLRLHGGGATRVLYFRRGEIASAASNADEDRLPSILIREGRLTAPQVEMARSKQRPGVSLGKTLIELGFLTPAELLAGARRQVRQILAAAFALREGTSQEAPGPLPPEVTVLGLPVRRLIFDALLEAGDRQAVVREMGSMETVYRPTADLDQAVAGMRLDPAHEEVARLVDGHATLREISGRVRLDDLTVSKIVLGLEILGLVERASPLEEPLPQGRRIPVLVEEDEEEEIAPRVETVAAAPVVSIVPAPAAFPPAPEAGDPAREKEPAQEEEDVPGATDDPPAFMAGPAPVPPEPARVSPAPAAFSEPPAAMAPPPSRLSPSHEDEDEEDLPLIPPGELPAFAAPANVPTGWTVDPETGEKVHMGPVEMTFDGSVVPPEDRTGSRGRLFLAASAVALVAAAVLAFFALRGEGRAGRDGDQVASNAAPAAAATGADAGPGSTAGSTAAPAGEASGAAPAETEAPPAQDTAPVPAQAIAPAPAEAAAPPPAAGAPSETGSAATDSADTAPAVPTAPLATAPASAVTPGGPGFGFGQRLLDAGTIDRAAETFGRALQPIPSGRYTLQMMIACEAETVRKARAGTRPDEGLFVLPISVRGRGCYRVMWGVFESHDAAAKATLPAYFSASGITPAVVALDRLRPPA